MVGYGSNLFGPNNTTNRAMIVAMLWRRSGSPIVNFALPFEDVAEGAWYTEAIRWAVSEGVASGYGNGMFGPNDPITREQMVTILYRYEKKYNSGGFSGDWMLWLDFTDADQVSAWAYEAMCWATINNIVEGIGNQVLDPKGKATRAQAAAIFMRYCEMTAE